MAKISLKNLKKIYDGKVTAVHDFTLDVNDKEFIVLVGPSGCGKSTVLRMIAGLEDISAGELYIGERKVNTVHPKNRDIAMVFQNYALYPHMTVYENMAFALKQQKTGKDIIDKKVRHAAEILGITDYLERRPKALSGGQRQRVAIGRAIVREPQVFLMDEPLSNLDAKLRNQMRSELIKLRQRINTTFVYVTHDQTEAMTLGDRIVIMQNGHIQQIGTPHEVFSKPANIFVAGFIGTPQMNFINAELNRYNEKYTITLCGTQFKLPDFMSSVLVSNKIEPKNITVGIRPEYMYLSEPDKNSIRAFIDVTEMMGSEMHIHANADGHSIVIKTPITKLSNANVYPGSSIKISIDVEFMQLFSAETGKNLIYY